MGQILLQDSLFFGSAAARALAVIDPDASWTVLMQDWQAATTALAFAAHDRPPRMFLTLHNVYDSPEFDAAVLKQSGIPPESCPGPVGRPRATILERVLNSPLLVNRPVVTVSQQFALDIVEDVFQTRVMAPHLTDLLRGRLRGIDNGVFGSPQIDRALLANLQQGRTGLLAEWKRAKRQEALAALAKNPESAEKPFWVSLSRFQSDEAPWFVMAGRDDARQKGYDVAATAVAGFLEQGGLARFLFLPIPGEEGVAGLGFLKKLATSHAESVLVVPFVAREAFKAILQAADFGLMPSLYEPFGMVSEFYFNGAVVIGRATGGIVAQVVPLGGVASFTESVRCRAARWHQPSTPSTGLLFREPDGIATAVADWHAINEAHYDRTGGDPDRVTQRGRLLIFQAMVVALRFAIIDATMVYRDRPNRHACMLTQGVAQIEQTFTWKRAAKQYAKMMIE